MNHLNQIAAKLDQYKLDAMLITSAPGEYYAIGFHGEGMVIVTKTESRYFTDSRYIEAAGNLVTGANITMTDKNKNFMVLAEQAIQELGIQKMGFEDGYVTVASYNQYSKLPCELVPAQSLVNDLRAAKDEEEIALMKKAQEITDQAFDAILKFIQPGMTEQEIAARLQYEMLLRGADKMSFDPIVVSGPNGSLPHGIPSEKKVQKGEFLTMDFGCIYHGYCSDMTRTVAVGQPTEEMERVYHTVLEAQRAGIAAARAGVTGSEVDRAARQVIQQAGYGAFFSHSFGHSLGLEIHESPNASPSEQSVLPTGAVISAEPGIYLPGRFGVRIEDVLVLREGGCEDITHSPKNLIVL